MIITIQSINKRFVVKTVEEIYSCKSMVEATRFAGNMANAFPLYANEKPTIRVLSIPFKPMAMKKRTYPAKKKAVVAKKKVVAKGKKK